MFCTRFDHNFTKKLLSVIFSFEMIFVLFLRSGRFKGDPFFRFMPIDLTLLFMLLGVCIICVGLLRGRYGFSWRAIWYVMGFIAFVGFACCSLVWTPSSLYSKEKLLRLVTICVYCTMVGSLVIGSDYERIWRFITSLFIVDLLIATRVAIASVHHVPGTFLSVLTSPDAKGAYLGISSVLCSLFVMLFVYSFYNRSLKVAIFMPILIFLILDVGARGPVVSMLISIGVSLLLFKFLPFLLRARISKKTAIIALGIVAILGVAIIISLSHNSLKERVVRSTVVRRFGVMVTRPHGGSSVSQRLYYFDCALRMFFDKPMFGWGIGSFPMLVSGADQRGYPHNILLELWAELGIAGFVLFLPMVLLPLVVLGKIYNQIIDDWIYVMLFGLWTYYFIWSMISGCLTSMREFYVLSGILSCCCSGSSLE